MSGIRWVIQNNLIPENDLKQIQEVCTEIGVECVEVLVIPYLDQLPDFPIDDKINIYYGSTTFMNNIYNIFNKPKGLFFNHETFSMENYIGNWGEHMLNCDGKIIKVSEFLAENRELNDDIFIRPDGDGKEFDGQVIKFKDAQAFFNRTLAYESSLTMESKILVGPAYNIFKEWRNYIIDGKIVSSSLYRKNFKLSKSNEDIPEDMLNFVRERIKEYKPHDCFAIDIASTHDGTYYIIECGCLNSVGFYASNIKDIIESITIYVLENNKLLTNMVKVL